eukprot:6185603-Pleurochrysis_carterae.AAC.3
MYTASQERDAELRMPATGNSAMRRFHSTVYIPRLCSTDGAGALRATRTGPNTNPDPDPSPNGCIARP